MNIQDLYKVLLGDEKSNPYTGQNNVDMIAASTGKPVDQVRKEVEDWRNYSGKRQQLDQLLQSSGLSLDELGYQNQKELGKSSYEQNDWAVENGFQPNGWEYDWASGKKHYVISSDPAAKDRWVPIDQNEMQQHGQAQMLKAKGFNTWEKMSHAQAQLRQGKSIDEISNGHSGVDINKLASIFHVDKSALSPFASLLGASSGSVGNGEQTKDQKLGYEQPKGLNEYGQPIGTGSKGKTGYAQPDPYFDQNEDNFAQGGKLPGIGKSKHIDPNSGAIIQNQPKPIAKPAPTWTNTLVNPTHGSGDAPEGGKRKQTGSAGNDGKQVQNFETPVPGLNRTKPNFTGKPYNFGA